LISHTLSHSTSSLSHSKSLKSLFQAVTLTILEKAFHRNNRAIARKNHLVNPTKIPTVEQLILAETLGGDVELCIAENLVLFELKLTDSLFHIDRWLQQ
jgi:hypothetical protein